MWPVAVTPRDAACARARARAESRCSGDGSGAACHTRSIARSLKTPPLVISPPKGDGVATVTPAARIAAALASASWPSKRFTKTGLFGVTESIHSCRGRGAPRHSV